MCGIAGVFHLKNHALPPSTEESVRKMIHKLRLRGPDGEGVLLQQNVCLGHTRLSIIDLAGGSQPMQSHDSRFSIVFNGEIYNFQELRETLRQKGAEFSSRSDTEVILEGYRFWGKDVLHKLDGMFAFALYDSVKKTLFLARDLFGKKPLFYTIQNNRFYFASEISALLALPELSFHISPSSIVRFLAYEYVIAPETIYEEVKSLKPSHSLLVCGEDLHEERYWDLPTPEPCSSSSRELEEELLRLLSLAVKKRMISDVPLGVFLSGGLDSSIVTALMAEASSSAVQTFSIGFEEASFDESKYARIIAERFSTSHHEEILRAEACAELLPQIIRQMDVPMADASIAPTYLLSKLTRKYVTVALGGDGSDELWAGYENYAAYGIALLYQSFPGPLRAAIEYLSQYLPKSAGYVNLHLAMQTFLRGAHAPDWLRIERLLASFDAKTLGTLLSDAFTESAALQLTDRDVFAPTFQHYHHWEESEHVSPLARTFYVYVREYLPEDILVKVDRASMLNSLEVRAPFLDRDLVEFTARLPLRYKFYRLKGKRLLRSAMRNHLPESILYRNKRGFQIPVAAWLRGKMRPLVEELLSPARLEKQGIFSPKPVERLMQEHFQGRSDHRKPLWTLLVLQLWLDAHPHAQTL